MASASGAVRLCLLTCRRAPRVTQLRRAQSVPLSRPIANRTIHTSASRLADGKQKRHKDGEDGDGELYEHLDLKTMNKAFAESVTPEGLRQLDELAKSNGFATVDEYLDTTLRETPGWGSEDRSLEEELYKDDVGERPNKSSFWFDEDDPEMNTEEHDEFDEDDITSMAHGKLDEVREMRHYARLAVWEMPLLAKMAKPFEPPTDDEVLRWRYTTYMGEFHPAEKKVVVQFAPDDLKLSHKLSSLQVEKIKKLAGPRYNPDNELVKMSCESFEHQAQNKAYLSKLVDDLIAAAKDPSDTFEDVPLDLRHHKSKTKPKFPPEWRMTQERKKQLEESREKLALADLERAQVEGGLVDGQKRIDEFLMQKLAEEQAKKDKVEELVAAPVPRGGARLRR